MRSVFLRGPMVERGAKWVGFSAGCSSTVLLFSCCYAEPLPECPKLLDVSQTVLVAPDMWAQVPYTGPQRLERVTVNNSAERSELRPDSVRETSGEAVFIWDVSDVESLWQQCVYSGTSARLVRPITGSRERCEVVLKSPHAGDVQIAARCD